MPADASLPVSRGSDEPPGSQSLLHPGANSIMSENIYVANRGRLRISYPILAKEHNYPQTQSLLLLETNNIPSENTQVVNGDRLKIDSRRRSQVRLLLLASFEKHFYFIFVRVPASLAPFHILKARFDSV
jgi:hypothetical protein